jgi:5-methyltetrahydrofolate--homocysteine methyltransferase
MGGRATPPAQYYHLPIEGKEIVEGMSTYKELSEALYNGDAQKVAKLVQAAVDSGANPADILNNGLIEGMNAVGKDFRDGILFVPEVLIAARAMHAGMNILKPLLAAADIEPVGRFAIGTVKGDLHDIGKNLVSMMMEGAGFEVINLGTDVPADKFVAAVKEKGAQVLGMSALLTTTMVEMKGIIQAIEEAGLRDKVKVVIGGAPVTQKFADEIGADGYAPNASAAVEVTKKLLGK